MAKESEIYAAKTVTEFEERTTKLAALEAEVSKATKSGSQITNGSEILKAVAEAAEDCESVLDYFDEDDPMPQEVAEAMKALQQGIKEVVLSVVAFMAVKKMLN